MLIEQIASHLQAKGPDKGGWYTALCPFHNDQRRPNLRFNERGFKCMACGEKGNLRKLAEKLRIPVPSASQIGLTVSALARAKQLPEEFLRSLGVSDSFSGSGQRRTPCVDIPYADEHGNVVAIRKRVSLHGNPKFLWRRGDHPTLYGLAYLGEVRKAGQVVLVEGESDAWTLKYHRVPVLGVPGVSTWKKEFAKWVEGLKVYVWHEPDGGGDQLLRAVSADHLNLYIIEPPHGVKDPSQLYLQEPQHFEKRLKILIEAARPVTEIRAEGLGAEARQAFAQAQAILEDPRMLERLAAAIQETGYAGDVRPALLGYIAVTSRLLEAPLNLAYIAPSAAGKNAAIDAALPFFPDSAYYLIRASSPLALVYNEETFQHRTVIVTEADSLPEEGPAASATRSLMSDREMTYEVVEKGDQGKFAVRKIVKPGPTGLITTSTRPLGEQATTRTLTVTISDSVEQTRLVLQAQASRANKELATPDLSPWLAMQQWLALAGEKRVVVPYAGALAVAVPAGAVRMRRDFPQLLSVVKSVAFLYQRLRERDSRGWIIAILDDYDTARWLLEEVFAVTVSEGVTPAVRQTVEAVVRLGYGGIAVSEHQLTKELGLAKSTIHYRVQRALKGGWLVNLATQKGAPAQLVVGTPLPDGSPLPDPSTLRVCVEQPQTHSNPRTAPSGADMGHVQTEAPETVRTGFESSSNEGSKGGQSYSGMGFEGFESKTGGHTHTQTTDSEETEKLPWDDFLEEADARAQKSK
jgi:hypothetical protein